MEQDMKKKIATIFVIEDDDMDFKLLIRTFREHNVCNPVLRAKDGIEALEMLRADEVEKPFVTLLDLNLPRLSGINFLHEIREDKNLAPLVIFVLTTSNNEVDKIKSYEKNVAGYILKSNISDESMNVIKMLDYYWGSVELPL